MKADLWYDMATNLQKESYAQSFIAELKAITANFTIQQGETQLISNSYYFSKVKFRSDGSGGVEFLFTIWTNGGPDVDKVTNIIYIHVYPYSGKAAFDLIGDIYNCKGGTLVSTYKTYSYYNEATGEKIDSLAYVGNDSWIEYFRKVYWTSSAINLIMEDYLGRTYCYGDEDKGGIKDRERGYFEFYNDKGDLILEAYRAPLGYTNYHYPLKYLNFKETYHQVARKVTNSFTSNIWFLWERGDGYVNVNCTNYEWWIETNNNTNSIDISLPVLEKIALCWNDSSNHILPSENILYLITNSSFNTTNYFDFAENNRANALFNILDNLSSSWSNTNFLDIVTNKIIPSW